MHSTLRRGLVIALVAACLQLLAPQPGMAGPRSCDDRGSTAEAPATGAIFNDAAGEKADQYRILSAVRSEIAATPAGGFIRIATQAINATSIVNALVRAHTCGVRVRVVVPGRAWDDPAVVTLRQELGTDTSRRSYIVGCDGACTTDGSRGIMHAKLYLFSQVASAGAVTDDLTMYSSSNLVRTQATKRYNDAYQVVGNSDVYASARTFFNQLKRNGAAVFPRLTASPGFRQYYFPSAEDFHHEVLDRTRCRSDDGRTFIDFAISIGARVDVVRQLAELQRDGCTVRVLVALDKIDDDVLRKLFDLGIQTHVQSLSEGVDAIHSKYIALRGSHRGHQVETVYCGSLNVSRYSARVANNVMLRIVDDADTYLAYHRHFMGLYDQARELKRRDVSSAKDLDARSAEGQS